MTDINEELSHDIYKEKIFTPAKDYLTVMHNDRESIIRLCRDINAYSKKMIFALHGLVENKVDKRAYSKIVDNVKVISKSIAVIHQKFSHKPYFHQFKTTISNSVEEMIEAFTFAYYLVSDDILTYNDFLLIVRALSMSYNEDVGEFDMDAIHYALDKLLFNGTENTIIDSDRRQISSDSNQLDVNFILMGDYIMGLFDLTGEIMRYSISGLNNSSSGMARAHKNLQFMKHLHQSLFLVFIKYPHIGLKKGLVNLDSDYKGNDAIKKKMSVLKQSIDKVQSVVCDMYIGRQEYQDEDNEIF